MITPVQNAWKGTTDVIAGFFTGLWGGIKSEVVSVINAVIEGIKSAINFIVSGVNNIISGFNKIVSWVADVIGEHWEGVTLIPKVSFGRVSIPAYSIGGFPEDGLFYANQNELVGELSNEKTAVANNKQIVHGIQQAAYKGMLQAIQKSGYFGGNVEVTIKSDRGEIFKVVKMEWKKEVRRLQKNPIPYSHFK